MINYPGGVRKNNRSTASSHNHRGKSLEEDINQTNQYYLEIDRAVIHKKPTPVQVVRVHYPKRSAAVIKEGYFQQPSTTDYNGLFQGKYIDFEAKQTENKTSIPLANFHEHQINHLHQVKKHGGICFLIIRFTAHDRTYFLPLKHLLKYWEKQFTGGRKSIPYSYIKENGYPIPFHYQARVNYLDIVEQLYF